MIDTRETNDASACLKLVGFDPAFEKLVREKFLVFEVRDDGNFIGFFIVKPIGDMGEIHTKLPFRGATSKMVAFGQVCQKLRERGLKRLCTWGDSLQVRIGLRAVGFRHIGSNVWKKEL